MCGQKVLPYIFLARSSSFYIYHDIWRSSFSFKYKKRVMGHGWCWGRSVVGVSRVILCLLETFLCADWYRAFFKHFFFERFDRKCVQSGIVHLEDKLSLLCSQMRPLCHGQPAIWLWIQKDFNTFQSPNYGLLKQSKHLPLSVSEWFIVSEIAITPTKLLFYWNFENAILKNNKRFCMGTKI